MSDVISIVQQIPLFPLVSSDPYSILSADMMATVLLQCFSLFATIISHTRQNDWSHTVSLSACVFVFRHNDVS